MENSMMHPDCNKRYDAEFTGIVRHSLVYAESPWEGSYSLNPALQIIPHWTAFTQPGWHYVAKGHGSYALPHGGGTITTLIGTWGGGKQTERTEESDNDKQDLTIVIETMNATVVQHLQLQLINVDGRIIGSSSNNVDRGSGSGSGGGGRVEMLYVWKTVEGKIFVPQSNVHITSNGSLPLLTLDPSSILTLSTIDVPHRSPLRKNQTTGEKVLPAPFPLPYSDTFDCATATATATATAVPLHGTTRHLLKRPHPLYKPEGMMRYLQELSGSFQVQPHDGGGVGGGYGGDFGRGVNGGHPDDEREGFLQQLAMSQVANTQWSASAFAVGMLGDSRWHDIAVTADVRLSVLASGGVNTQGTRDIHRQAGATNTKSSWMPYPSVQLKACVKGGEQQQWKLANGGRSILTADGQHALSVQGGHDTGSNGVRLFLWRIFHETGVYDCTTIAPLPPACFMLTHVIPWRRHTRTRTQMHARPHAHAPTITAYTGG